MGTKKQKKRILKRKRATKAIKKLGRRREEQVVDWLYEGYSSHYKPEIQYQQYVESYDKEIVNSVFGRCKFKNLDITYSDLETFYGMRRKRFKKRQAREYQKRLEQQCIRVIWLGTANAHAMNFYNTCFAIRDHKKTFLVDSGGGQFLIRQLQKAQIGYNDIHDIFITHNHLDHILGLFFLLRDIAHRMDDDKYDGDLRIFGSKEVINTIRKSCDLLLDRVTKYFDNRIKFIEIHNGETFNIIGQEVTFFDTHSETKEQFGFTMKTKNDVRFAYLGDVPYVDDEYEYVKDVDYLVHEAACKQADRKLFKPEERGHSTLKQACENYHKTGARYLIITHTEDHLGDKRGPQYRHEAAADHHTMIMVPDDLETIFLKKPSKQRSYFDTGEETEEKVNLQVDKAKKREEYIDSLIEAIKSDEPIENKQTFNLKDLNNDED